MTKLPKGTEKDRFLLILGQAKHELDDGAEIPYVPKRTFSEAEHAYIEGICHYIEKLVKYYDFRGWLVREPYDANKCDTCQIAATHNLEDNDSPCLDCEEVDE
jgi:hypothetical protein